ncbi:hypothetical protein CRG98_031152 [Punica granatum]|uniref:Uncharacterized protein n=1 Tax=Punica granatum TaxID=22663 RepID=A0A2I0IWR8_PUNGR|nr:hypothetical protein CRG98_031152 [Punica granatum]
MDFLYSLGAIARGRSPQQASRFLPRYFFTTYLGSSSPGLATIVEEKEIMDCNNLVEVTHVEGAVTPCSMDMAGDLLKSLATMSLGDGPSETHMDSGASSYMVTSKARDISSGLQTEAGPQSNPPPTSPSRVAQSTTKIGANQSCSPEARSDGLSIDLAQLIN